MWRTHIVQQLVKADHVWRLTKILRTCFPWTIPERNMVLGREGWRKTELEALCLFSRQWWSPSKEELARALCKHTTSSRSTDQASGTLGSIATISITTASSWCDISLGGSCRSLSLSWELRSSTMKSLQLKDKKRLKSIVGSLEVSRMGWVSPRWPFKSYKTFSYKRIPSPSSHKKDKFLSGVWLWFQVKVSGEFCGNPSLKLPTTLPGSYPRPPHLHQALTS